MNPLRKIFYRFANADALAVATLAIVAWLVAGFLVRDDVFLYGDHPGHYWLMWYTLNVAAPLQHRLLDWIPYWYAGYPELQFTPPGFALLGWLINLVTLGKVSTALIYEIVVFTAYALPAFTFYYAVRHLGFDRRAAFAAGIFGLVFPAFFDGAIGLFIGMVGSRLAFALNALFFVWTIDALERRGRQYLVLAGVALAAIVLAHPYHAIGITLALGAYVLARRLALTHALAIFGGVVALAAALDAFWLAPLIAHSGEAMLPLLRANLDQTWHIITDASLLPYAVLALPALLRVRRETVAERRGILIALVVLLCTLGVAMLALHPILIDGLNFYKLDPIRLIGEYYFALIWLAAIGIGEIGDWLKRFGTLPGWGVTALAGIVLLIPLWQSVTFFQPRAGDEPRFLSQAISDYRLTEFWQVLRETPGRVLFTAYSTNLNARGGEPVPTTLTSLTPLFADRAMMGGTYSHWSPVAAWMWTGKPNPPALIGLSQEQDDHALFGIPLEKLTDVQFIAACERFNITAIVASVNDVQTRTFLDASPRLQSYYNNGFFFVYRIKDFDGAWLAAQNANVELIELADDQIVLRVHNAQANASVGVKIYAYPLWRATTDQGQTLSITPDDAALMRIVLPPGENYTVTLQYQEGSVEQLGSLASIVTIVLSTIALGFSFYRRRKRATHFGSASHVD